MNYCRSCTTETDDLVLDDIRGDGVMFPVCHKCASGSVAPANPVERSYEGAGPSMSVADVSDGARRAMGDEEYDRIVRQEGQWSMSPAARLPQDEVDLRIMHRDTARRFRGGSARSVAELRRKAAKREQIGRVTPKGTR